MDQKRIGQFIAQLRQEKGLTQAQLGQRLGVTNKTVSRWENGNYMPDVSLLTPLARELGTGVNELLAGQRIGPDSEYRQKADEAVLSVMRSSFSWPHRRAFWRQKWLREHAFDLALGFLCCGGVMALLCWLGNPLIGAGAGCALFALRARGQLAEYLAGKEDLREAEEPPEEET